MIDIPVYFFKNQIEMSPGCEGMAVAVIVITLCIICIRIFFQLGIYSSSSSFF